MGTTGPTQDREVNTQVPEPAGPLQEAGSPLQCDNIKAQILTS